MSAFTPLETAHLRIRPFAVDDWQAVHAYTGDAAVMQFVDGRPMTEAQTRQFIVENMGDEARHFAIELREGIIWLGIWPSTCGLARGPTRSAGYCTPATTVRGTPPRRRRPCCVTALNRCACIG
jgi:hypothetical protein